jgi:CRP-like cAMP-binding protein
VPTTVTQPSENRVLSSLSREDANLIAPALQQLNLPLRKQLESRNRRIEYVYFIDHGIASVVANGSVRGGIEIGIIGREGVTGLAVLMGADRSPHETYMQVGGAGRRVSAASLRSALLRHGYAFTVQMAQTALANGRHKLEERLARWLLMAHDRVDGDELPLTHEFLSLMLGVRRSGVTVALKILEREGMVKARRGGVTITDRDGLEECANGAYRSPDAELRR